MSVSPPPRWGRWGVRRRILAWKNVLAFRLHGRRPPCRSGSKLAIFKTDRMGDFTLTTGAIRWLVRQWGAERCVLFIAPPAQELARREFPGVSVVVVPAFVDELLPGWKRHRGELTGGLHEHCFETAISLRHQRTPWHELLFSRLRARNKFALTNQTLGYHAIEAGWIRATLSSSIPVPTKPGVSTCLELESHRQLLEQAFGVQVSAADVLPSLTPSQETNPNGALLLCPFGSEKLRTLPIKVAVPALKQMYQQVRLPLRLASPPGDRKRFEEYADALVSGGLPRPEIVETPNLEALLGELSSSRAVFCIDSGPAHLALALGRPTVVLLGGGHPGVFGPWQRNARQTWLTKPMDCYGCDWYCTQPEPYCMTEIDPAATARALLNAVAAG
jgi:ADP-heptose:LPS heptosyltransferase